MRKRGYKFYENEYPYFLTCMLIDGIPLFNDTEVADIVIDSLNYAQKNLNMKIYCYVIMNNHFHMIAKGDDLSKYMHSIKSYTAKMILNSLKARNRIFFLSQLKKAKKQYKTKTEYQVWDEGSHPIIVNSRAKMARMMDYIHQNPVKAGYVESAKHWRYSSYVNYIGVAGLIDVDIIRGYLVRK